MNDGDECCCKLSFYSVLGSVSMYSIRISMMVSKT